MPGRNLREANAAFIEPIKASLSNLGQMKVLQSRSVFDDHRGDHSWNINGGEGVTLGHLRFEASMIFTYRKDPELPDNPWRVRTKAYEYKITTRSNDREILVWHWQPASPGPTEPHLHIGSAVLNPGTCLSSKDHVPTGRVAIEEIVRMLIRELKVQPTKERWAEQLLGTEQKFRLYSSWGAWSPPTQ